HIARFHLGLFYLMAGRQQEAETTWQSLDNLGDRHYLNLFKQGLLKIVYDQVQEGITLLEMGIENNQVNETLNQDMQAAADNARLALANEEQL
ncbi:MAG: hypothetical protein PVH04_03120, partial [Gammaproteobacteria bacterium]